MLVILGAEVKQQVYILVRGVYLKSLYGSSAERVCRLKVNTFSFNIFNIYQKDYLFKYKTVDLHSGGMLGTNITKPSSISTVTA
jgi:hypothetical protein